MSELPDMSVSLMHDWYPAMPGYEHGVSRIRTRDADSTRFRHLTAIEPLDDPRGRW